MWLFNFWSALMRSASWPECSSDRKMYWPGFWNPSAVPRKCSRCPLMASNGPLEALVSK